MSSPLSKNVLGEPLEACCLDPATGFMRDGYCQAFPVDPAKYVVCASMTQAFLDYSTSKGNDLSTARPDFGFPGLKPGDTWCLCVIRWKEAYEDGVAPPVELSATHQSALETVALDALKTHAKDLM